MTNNTTFRRAADRTRKSAFVLPIWLVYLILFSISLVIMREDIMTSLWGYQALPTQAGFGITAWAVALLPSIGQLATGYVTIALADSENDRGYAIVSGIVWICLFLVDTYTDVYFRNGFTWQSDYETILTSIFQTIGIFTIGSELFFVLGFGMMAELFPDAIVEFFGINRKIKYAWNERMREAENSYSNRPNQNQQNNNNRR